MRYLIVVFVVLLVLVMEIVMLTTKMMGVLIHCCLVRYLTQELLTKQCLGTDIIMICCWRRCIAMKYFHPTEKYLYPK